MVPLEVISLAIVIAVALLVYFVYGSFLCGAGYQPSFPSVAVRMLEMAEVGPTDRLYDPGAGTGALLFRAARKRGAHAVGIEIEPLRILILRLRRIFGPARDRIEVRWENIFRADYRSATVVAAFLWPDAMRRLRPIFEEQLSAGTRVVSHWHPVPDWRPAAIDPQHRIYLYRYPECRAPGPAAT